MSAPLILHEDCLFPAGPSARSVARALYGEVAGLPMLSPHGHTYEAWFATNAAFGKAAGVKTRDVAVDLAYNLPERAQKTMISRSS